MDYFLDIFEIKNSIDFIYSLQLHKNIDDINIIIYFTLKSLNKPIINTNELNSFLKKNNIDISDDNIKDYKKIEILNSI